MIRSYHELRIKYLAQRTLLLQLAHMDDVAQQANRQASFQGVENDSRVLFDAEKVQRARQQLVVFHERDRLVRAHTC